MSDNPFSEFSEYPALKPNQESVLQSIGLALFGVQGVEFRLKFLLSFVFPENEQATLEELYAEDQKERKETLGRLISRLKGQCDVSEEFQRMLEEFLVMRNRFVHGLLQEPEYSLGSDTGIQRTEEFISNLENHTWFIDSVLMGYIVIFTKALGLDVPDDSITGQNRHKYFSPELNLKSAELDNKARDTDC